MNLFIMFLIIKYLARVYYVKCTGNSIVMPTNG